MIIIYNHLRPRSRSCRIAPKPQCDSARSDLPASLNQPLLFRPAGRYGARSVFGQVGQMRLTASRRRSRTTRFDNKITAARHGDAHRLHRRHRRLSLTTDKFPTASPAPPSSRFGLRNIGRPQDFRTSSRRARARARSRESRVPISRERAILILHLTIGINYYERRMRAQRRVSRKSPSERGATSPLTHGNRLIIAINRRD